MGQAWFWPSQPRIAALIAELGLTQFDQFSDGIMILEDERGQVQRGSGFASMQRSWLLKGGFGALISAISDNIPHERKRLNAEIISLTNKTNQVSAALVSGEEITADQVVLALPPRLAAQINLSPRLPNSTLKSMQNIATWMAGEAKAIAVYDRPFWRDAGLSGDAMSRHGPMVEIRDASPDQGGPYALFGFIGVPPDGRTDEQFLRQNLLAQFGRLFGNEAMIPAKLYLKDWAFDHFTATQQIKPCFTPIRPMVYPRK